MEAKLLLDTKSELGEGALWDERESVLYRVDIMGKKLHRYNPSTGKDEVFNVGKHVGTVVLDDSGGVLLAVQDGFARFDLETETLEMIATPGEYVDSNRFNDGKASPDGSFWAGTMAYDGNILRWQISIGSTLLARFISKNPMSPPQTASSGQKTTKPCTTLIVRPGLITAFRLRQRKRQYQQWQNCYQSAGIRWVFPMAWQLIAKGNSG